MVDSGSGPFLWAILAVVGTSALIFGYRFYHRVQRRNEPFHQVGSLPFRPRTLEVPHLHEVYLDHRSTPVSKLMWESAQPLAIVHPQTPSSPPLPSLPERRLLLTLPIGAVGRNHRPMGPSAASPSPPASANGQVITLIAMPGCFLTDKGAPPTPLEIGVTSVSWPAPAFEVARIGQQT